VILDVFEDNENVLVAGHQVLAVKVVATTLLFCTLPDFSLLTYLNNTDCCLLCARWISKSECTESETCDSWSRFREVGSGITR